MDADLLSVVNGHRGDDHGDEANDRRSPNFQDAEETENTPNATIDEIVQATVRAMISYDAIRDRNRRHVPPAPQTPTTEPPRKFKNEEIAMLLPQFAGAGQDIEIWLQRVEAVEQTYGVDPKVMTLIAVGKLCDQAKAWYHSKTELVMLDWQDLKIELKKMFGSRPDRISRMRRFEARKWKKGEKFSTYFHDKIMLGNCLNLPEHELIDYVIDGFTSESLQSQARIKDFQSLDEMLRIMCNVSTTERTSEKHYPPSSVRSQGTGATRSASSAPSTTLQENSRNNKCFNCYGTGHYADACPKPKRERGSCFSCGKRDHQVRNCPNKVKLAAADSTTMCVDPEDVQIQVQDSQVPNVNVGFNKIYELNVLLKFDVENTFNSINLTAMLDTGSPISLIKVKYLSDVCINKDYVIGKNYFGLNGSSLNILGIFKGTVFINNILVPIMFHVVPNETMSFGALVGRDFTSLPQFKITLTDCVNIEPSTQHILENSTVGPSDDPFYDILQIDCDFNDLQNLNINSKLSPEIHNKIETLFVDKYVNAPIPENPIIDFEMKISVKNNQPISFRPRKLAYDEKLQLQEIIDDLLETKVIRESDSPYCSPIVLVNKKNGSKRLCVDYRAINKIIIRDNYPIPLIDDQLNLLKNKNYFTSLDLKNSFHQVRVADDSIKYTSFICPLGQFEYLKMPFGLSNSPSVFMRFVNKVFKDLIKQQKVLIYLDDILIATSDIDSHLKILSEVFLLLTNNLLELRVNKCSFVQTEILYLGYIINCDGIQPNPQNVQALNDYPIPTTTKKVQQFLGLASYFRRFIPSFSILAKPLYDLLRKGRSFKFESSQLEAFNVLKSKLIQAPVLAIFSPDLETELHCDASSIGFGAILLQKQKNNLFQPVFYFSKRTSEPESKLHSYELEMLAIVSALERFRTFLQGLPTFKIVTDCNSIKLALNKKEINRRINRWALILQNYNYILEHREGNRMRHVDALSRANSVLILEENTFEQNLSIAQNLDENIKIIKEKLLLEEDTNFELRNGLVYRKLKDKSKTLFYVPQSMESKVLFNCHDSLGHLGIDKTLEYISRVYWFPNLQSKIKNYIQNCIKCISYSAKKFEGTLHNVPKGDKPFLTLHIDHYGPLEKSPNNKKYVFEVIDGFTKFVKLYDVKSTKTIEVIHKLEDYFQNYSRPLRIVSDRGTAFTSTEFETFLNNNNVVHVKIATGSPKSNGQIERINRDLTPMLSKLTDVKNKWPKYLPQVEFAINNSFCRSIGTTPSKLLFGVNQRDPDELRDWLDSEIQTDRNLEQIRSEAQQQNLKVQDYNKTYFDKKHKTPFEYKVGDYVMVKNMDVTPGVNKKLIPKFRGPYEIRTVLDNDRYVISDVENFQLTQRPFEGISSPDNMKLWLH